MFGTRGKPATRGGAQTLEQLETLYAKGNKTQALDRLRELVAEQPQSAKLRIRLADWLADAGQRDDAISVLYKLQESLAAKGNLLAAISTGLKIVMLDPQFENPLSYVAKVNTDRLREKELDVVRDADGEGDPVATGDQRKLSDIPLLSELEPEELSSIALQMKSRFLHPGAVVFAKGELSRSLCFIVNGTLEIQADGRVLDTATAGQCLGEFAFFTGEPRSATLVARDDSEILELSHESMQKALESHPRIREVLDRLYQGRVLARVLADSPLFGSMEAGERHRIAAKFQLVDVPKGDSVIEAGSEGGALFLVKRGGVEIRAPQLEGSTEAGGAKLGSLGPHEFFGEISFLTSVPRTANIRTTEDSELLRIDRDDLQELVDEHPLLLEVLKEYHLERAMNAAKVTKAAARV
jgi:CRP-like cAMP-binding protein